MASFRIMSSWWFTCSLLATVALADRDDDSDEDSDEDERVKEPVHVKDFAIIVGAIVAAIFILGLIALCCWLVIRHRRTRQNRAPILNYRPAAVIVPTAPTAPLVAESTFSQTPYNPSGGAPNSVVVPRDSRNGNVVATSPNRRSSPPPPYESLFSDSGNQGEPNYQTKPHYIQKE